jgi:cell division protein FtsQ
VAKTEVHKGRGAALVEDEPDLLRPAAPTRSRVEKEFLPDNFDRIPAKRPGEIGNDVRIRRRVPIKKGILPAWTKTRWGRIAALTLLLAVVAGVVAAALAVQHFFEHDPRFRIDSSDSIQTMGNSQLTRPELLSVFGADIGRNIFYIPLSERRAELEQIPWVEHATVMRILPNQLRVAVRERTPMAFVRIGDQIKLVDGAGVILDMPPVMMAARHFSFPVVTGINPRDPLSMRAARMQLYQKFIAAIDSSGEHLSSNVSEINLSDPEDVRVTVPMKSSDLMLHFGDTNFLARYRIYQSHLSEWEQQYPQLASVDLRYDSEVVLKMAGDSSADKESARSSPDAASALPVNQAAVKKHAPAAKRHAERNRE